MNKIIVLFLSLLIGFVSCKTSDKKNSKLEIVQKYYKALNNSNETEMVALISNNIIIRESESNYQEEFSQKKYAEWLKWDSVFNPTYKILEIELENNVVKTKVSKIDKRIFFLHTEPIVWHEIIRFDTNKITMVERNKYEAFNVTKFLKNRDTLVTWIKKKQPELDGFINDQTESGGIKYLKAIELYEKEN